MKKTNTLFLNLYLITGIIHIYAIISGIDNYITISKYLLIPLLLLHVLINCRNKIYQVLTLIAALFFCWAGDAFLIYADDNSNYFLFGLASFLVGHLFYIFSFNKFADKTPSLLKGKSWVLFLPILYSIILLVIVFKGLGDMKVPVIIYASAITVMSIAAINRYKRTDTFSFVFVFIGALFFVGSDSLIALNKFHAQIESAPLIIMSTYIIAQYMIVSGLLLHINKEEHAEE